VRKWTAQNCGEAAYCLRQFSFRLQQAFNRESARVKWCNESIDAIIAPILMEYRGYSFDERKVQAVRDNDAAKKFDELRVKASLRMERLLYLSTKVSEMAKTLEALQFSKRGQQE
jgi:hypothetical protein